MSHGSWDISVLQLLGKRSTQQDAFFVEEFGEGPALALAVADGHGFRGAEAAHLAATHIVAEARRLDANSGKWLAPAFRNLHERVASIESVGMELPSSGTTLTFALLRGSQLLWGFVGDSQARLARRDGTLKTLTIPHRYGVHTGETRRLLAAGAEITPDRYIRVGDSMLEVSRTLGDVDFAPFTLPDPEMAQMTLTDEFRFLLVGTDGLWDKLVPAKRRHVVERILSTASDVRTAQLGLEDILSRWKIWDNLTLVIVELDRRSERVESGGS